MGTGFLDNFTPAKGNFEPALKAKGEMKKPSKATRPKVQPKAQPKAQPTVLKEKPKAAPSLSQDSAPVALPNANPAIIAMINSARAALITDNQFILCGIYGPPKSGKTGGVLDSLTPEEIKNGAEIWHLDYDLGGASTRSAHHADKAKNIVVLNPWVFNYNSETTDTYDFLATYHKTLGILKAAQAQVEHQREFLLNNGHLPNPYLKTIVFDGADQWLHICETCMKIEDLELGADGLDAAVYLRQHEKGDQKKKSVNRFNWNLRTIRYQVAIHMLRELCRNNIHAFVITHTKPNYDNQGNELAGDGQPKWHKDTEGMLQQEVRTWLEEERNESGELTGIVKAYASLITHRTNLSSPKKWCIFERNEEGGKWFGWSGIAQGKFGGEQ
jgi:hypothetical protein